MKTNFFSASDLFVVRISARLALCSLAVAALTFASAAEGATPGAWDVVRSPSIGNQNTPYAVTCTSPTQCFAVGDYWAYPEGLTANGLAPKRAEEAAIFTPLPPGNYTAIVAGKDGGIGLALVEFYNIR